MPNLRDLSFRYKIPLRSTALILITAVPLAITSVFQEYKELKHLLVQEKIEMGRVLAQNLFDPMTQNDLPHCYRTIHSVVPRRPSDDPAATELVALVLDATREVYVSSDPARYPAQAPLPRAVRDFGAIEPAIASLGDTGPKVVEIPESNRIYVLHPILGDGRQAGTLILGFSESALLPDVYHLAKMSVLITLVVLAVLLPLSWYWAHRMAIPLVQLARCMGRIGPNIPDDLQCVLYESKDEIGQVGAAFKEMFAELQRKENLERQMAASQRLAAVGRLSAGIAHEINNPLGGMLNAVNTLKHHGNPDPLTSKTISLLERGLIQIKDTVAALLLETRVESTKRLTRQDIEDTRTLVLGKVKRRSAVLQWRNDLTDDVALPSTLVRQIIINLLLNAIQAADQNGTIRCHVWRDPAALSIVVENDGRHIPPERMEHLFEPFSSQSDGGHGLGLWVTYQAVQQMGGEISARSEPGETRFAISLPLEKSV